MYEFYFFTKCIQLLNKQKHTLCFLKKKSIHCVFLPNYNRLTYDFLSIMIKVRQKRNIIIQVK